MTRLRSEKRLKKVENQVGNRDHCRNPLVAYFLRETQIVKVNVYARLFIFSVSVNIVVSDS